MDYLFRLVYCISVACSGRVYTADITKVNILRDQIESHFDDLVDKLNVRKKELLDELDKKVVKLLSEQEMTEKLINDYEYEISRNDFESEFLKSFHQRSLKQRREELKELNYHRTKDVIYFEWDIDIVRDLDKFGKIEFKEKINYLNKTTPVIKASNREVINNPQCVTIDKQSNNIYVVDYRNNRVQVLDSKGKSLYKFGKNSLGKMYQPSGIAIYDEKVFVSQFDSKCVNIYDLDGNYIGQFGNSVIESETINKPTGLAISHKNGDIYVCDWNKDIVFVYTNKLKYKSSFGKGKLYGPRDITVTHDRIYVLGLGNPCIHIFNSDHSYSHSILSRGTDGQVGNPLFFTVDIEDNILLSDFERYIISVFTHDGKLIHEIGKDSGMFILPMGIVIDDLNRVIVVDSSEVPLKIF